MCTCTYFFSNIIGDVMSTDFKKRIVSSSPHNYSNDDINCTWYSQHCHNSRKNF